MPDIERETLSLQQAAKLMGTDFETTYSAVFDHQLVRLCIYTQFVPEFSGATELLECRLSDSQADFSSLYEQFPDKDVRLDKRSELDLLESLDDEITQDSDFQGIRWKSPPPRLLYVKLNHAHFSPTPDTYVPVGLQRLKSSDKLFFERFETWSGIPFSFFREGNPHPVSVALEYVLISRREVSRVRSLLSGPDADQDSTHALEWLIAMELHLLLDSRAFQYGDRTSKNAVAEYIRRFVEPTSGLSSTHLSKKIESAMNLLSNIGKM